MCRMLGYAARHDVSLRAAVGGGLSAFADLSRDHRDGWGAAWLRQGAVACAKQPTAAHSDARFWEAVDAIYGRAAMVHLRWASGTPHTLENTHPLRRDDVAFAHNGSIQDVEPLIHLIPDALQATIEGQTDSEIYFLALLAAWQRTQDLATAVEEVVAAIDRDCGYSGINFLIVTPLSLHAFCGYRPGSEPDGQGPDYYDLHYRVDADGVVVASTGWEADRWDRLENGSLLSVTLDDMRHQVHRVQPLAGRR